MAQFGRSTGLGRNARRTARSARSSAVLRYHDPVTASWSFDEQPHTGDPLLPGAAPVAIHDALLPEDRAAFQAAYQLALIRAREDLDLTELFQALEHWRRLALLQRDPARFTSIARRAAERLTGTLVPEEESLTQTRRRAGI
jgi:Family of unknown function (DUF6247)